MTTSDSLLEIVWKRRVTLAVAFVAAMAGVVVATFLLPRVYSTTAYVLVTPAKQPGGDYAATQLSQVLTKTYAELLQTRNVADAAAQRLPFETSGSELQHAVEVRPIPDSQLLQVTGEAATPDDAQALVNTYVAVFIEREGAAGPDRPSPVRLEVAERAPRIESPSRPQPLLYIAVGAIVSALAAAGLALLRHRVDQRIDVDIATTEVLGLPVLGHIPHRSGADDERATAEAFRFLIANLAFAAGGARPASLAVVSASPQEGKSTTALNLAVAAAEMGARALLVDADLRRQTLTARVAPPYEHPSIGLSGWLLRRHAPNLADAVVAGPAPGLSILPSGPIPPNPPALLSSPTLASFDDLARRGFELVVYDTPPLSIGADASLVAAQSEGVILVLDARRSRRTALAQAVNQLRRADAQVLGVVVNRVTDAGVRYGYGYGHAPEDLEAITPLDDEPVPIAEPSSRT
jgi:succinoglycan biosynthesis transport protein ExoP